MYILDEEGDLWSVDMVLVTHSRMGLHFIRMNVQITKAEHMCERKGGRESAFRCLAIEPSFKCETIKIGTQLAHLHRYQSNGKQIEKMKM